MEVPIGRKQLVSRDFLENSAATIMRILRRLSRLMFPWGSPRADEATCRLVEGQGEALAVTVRESKRGTVIDDAAFDGITPPFGANRVVVADMRLPGPG
jgi:hypothetical protein